MARYPRNWTSHDLLERPNQPVDPSLIERSLPACLLCFDITSTTASQSWESLQYYDEVKWPKTDEDKSMRCSYVFAESIYFKRLPEIPGSCESSPSDIATCLLSLCYTFCVLYHYGGMFLFVNIFMMSLRYYLFE